MIERINYRRILTILGIIFITILFSIFLGLYENLFVDEWYCLSFVDLVFVLIFIFELEFSRSKAQLAQNRNSYFLNIMLGYVACSIISAIFVLLPVYCKPVMVLPIIIFAISNELIAFLCSCYFIIVLSLTVSGDYYELLSQFLLVILCVVINQVIYNKKLKVFSYIMLFCLNILIPAVFYYWEHKEKSTESLIYGTICGVVVIATLLLSDKIIKPFCDKEVQIYMLDMLSDDYSLVKDIKADSSNEYVHAKRVSDIAYKCAKYCGLNADICAVGGFYYRLGKWLGEPHIKNGVKKAQEMCFPVEIIYILFEYYGEEIKPSTPESSLVHMVDALVKKMESINSEIGRSDWNNEMIIYQTLNEFSASGIYDESGLSMNHFLKIREYLAKEHIFS